MYIYMENKKKMLQHICSKINLVQNMNINSPKSKIIEYRISFKM